jgi:hypothetical protein
MNDCDKTLLFNCNHKWGYLICSRLDFEIAVFADHELFKQINDKLESNTKRLEL